MTTPTRSNEFFETLSKVLLRCWIFGFAFVTFWFLLYILAGDFIYRLHGYWFGLSKHEMDVIFYCGMGLLKLLVIEFFFTPWLAIRLLFSTTMLATNDRKMMICRHEAAHAIAAYRFQIPFKSAVFYGESSHLVTDDDAIQLTLNAGFTPAEGEALVVSLCAMRRIAWLVDSMFSGVSADHEWDNAGGDNMVILQHIGTLGIKCSGVQSLDHVFTKFMKAGHNLAKETIELPRFSVALEALTASLYERGQLSDFETTQVIEDSVGKEMLISDSLPDYSDKPESERRGLRFKDAVSALAAKRVP